MELGVSRLVQRGGQGDLLEGELDRVKPVTGECVLGFGHNCTAEEQAEHEHCHEGNRGEPLRRQRLRQAFAPGQNPILKRVGLRRWTDRLLRLLNARQQPLSGSIHEFGARVEGVLSGDQPGCRLKLSSQLRAEFRMPGDN